jgi:Ring finger domain
MGTAESASSGYESAETLASIDLGIYHHSASQFHRHHVQFLATSASRTTSAPPWKRSLTTDRMNQIAPPVVLVDEGLELEADRPKPVNGTRKPHLLVGYVRRKYVSLFGSCFVSTQSIPARKTFILRIENKGETCVICLEPWGHGHEVRILPCGHTLHKLCIDRWSAISGRCPVDNLPIDLFKSRDY